VGMGGNAGVTSAVPVHGPSRTRVHPSPASPSPPTLRSSPSPRVPSSVHAPAASPSAPPYSLPPPPRPLAPRSKPPSQVLPHRQAMALPFRSRLSSQLVARRGLSFCSPRRRRLFSVTAVPPPSTDSLLTSSVSSSTTLSTPKTPEPATFKRAALGAPSLLFTSSHLTPSSSHGEFQITTDFDSNSYVQNGHLYIMLTLSSDVIVSSSVITGSNYSPAAPPPISTRWAPILHSPLHSSNSPLPSRPPAQSEATAGPLSVMSARMSTKGNYSIQCSKIQVRPQGACDIPCHIPGLATLMTSCTCT
jgi:hypothetical protein